MNNRTETGSDEEQTNIANIAHVLIRHGTLMKMKYQRFSIFTINFIYL